MFSAPVVRLKNFLPNVNINIFRSLHFQLILKVNMSLLPKTEIDFAKTEYWNNFFKERGTKKFEWYGEYTELCQELHTYLKKQDCILVVGCGNSLLSSDLFDVGYRQITNIDISSVAIKQMKRKVGRNRPAMVFEEMDALNMTFKNESFTAVLDKGTLDALMPQDTDSDRERAKKLFCEVDRVLKPNGRYIIISLLQKHILWEILRFFTALGWMIRIIRCWDVEKRSIEETGSLTMPVFMVVCVKLKKMEKIQTILEVNLFVNRKSERLTSEEEVMGMIDGVQKTIFWSREANEEIEIIFCRKGEEKPRYSIYVVDVSKDQRKLLKYAAFIVPRGREVEWMFGTKEGRRYLRESSGFDRLAVIIFHRHQDYGSMNEIQDELRQTVLQLAPCFMPLTDNAPRIPYLTLEDGIGCREIIYSGRSDFSGDLVVEDVEVENEIFRRLIFMNNQAVVQSEVKLHKVPSRSTRDEKPILIDLSHIASKHIIYMSLAAALKAEEPLAVAVIGLGGGGLCLFLHKLFPKAIITGVEIDPLIVKLAEEYFGLETDERLKIVVIDGVQFLKRKLQFDIIMLDVDSKECGSAISSPPPQFVEPSVLEAISLALGENGIFVTNVVSRVSAEHNNLIKKIREHFSVVSWYNLKEDVNRIIFASNLKYTTEEQWRQKIRDAALVLDQLMQEKMRESNQLLELEHLVENLMI